MRKPNIKPPARAGVAILLGQAGLLLSQPALADINCPPPTSSTSPTTCTVGASDTGNLTIDYTAAPGTGSNNGGYGGNYIVVNNGYLGPSPQQAPLFVRLTGGAGSPDGDDTGTLGGWGGLITVTNNESVGSNGSPVESAQSTTPGIWDDASAQFGIYAASVGGTGGTPPDTVFGGGNGGAGGNGSPVSITNNGQVTVQNLPYGGVGVYGASIGGTGGNQMSDAGGDQVGGNGGNSDIIYIANYGSVTVSSGNAGRYAWGIAAESIGGAGGHDNGWGGTGGGANPQGVTQVVNAGKVQVQVETPGGATSNLLTDGVRGMYAISQGNDGFTSNDGTDKGGAGGGFGTVGAVNFGQISVTSSTVQAPTSLSSLSGGVVVVGLGGEGGGGPNTVIDTGDEVGGVGGTSTGLVTAVLNDGSSLSTSGNYLPGVSVISQGGNGGIGYGSSNGGNGGNGGTAQVTLNGSASVSTAGLQSHGIVVRSNGGAGGGLHQSSGLVDFQGEDAGVGGAGGRVIIDAGDAQEGVAGGSIRTQGDYSIGMLGQSMGGIGGATSGNFEMFGNAGADAGNGGASGSVQIDSLATITTYGTSSHGIVAQAIGGGGGTAGPSAGLVSVGGGGGTAVDGGSVSVSQNGSVSTGGSAAIGILAQSIGGGGGDGGAANGVAVIGGTAGGGGAGGYAVASLEGFSVQTGGDHGYGIVAQAIGGGGGTGGAASAYDANVAFSMAVAVGGAGGNGGAGGTASVDVSNATVATGSSDAHGVIVQSVGGGGGAGGASVAKAMAVSVPDESASFGVAVSFAMGGTGGSGGVGSTATATLGNAVITTQGGNAQGVIVQSIGGGGGVGGSASATSTVIGTGESIGGSLQSALGGSGGNGDAGGAASLVMQGSSIATAGDSANAILVQSVGGGGGAGGVGSATGRTANTDANVSLSIALGGVGGSGGDGGAASLTIDAGSSLSTQGDGARGALVQSIGGGGGASQGGQVGLQVQASEEDGSTDVGGTVEVGRGGGGGGNGGAIVLNGDGNITTHGADADGLLVQSIGGSGGLGGAVGGDSAASSLLSPVEDAGTTYRFNVYVGGSGGAGGAGGAIGSAQAPAILGASTQTYGDYADAVVLQSIGGGGGAGGASAVSSSVSTSNVTLAVGGRGGNGGAGGDITAWLNDNGGNNFNTAGFGAAGIVLQSIGGGGGMAGSGSPSARGAMTLGGTNGNGGSVTIASGSWANIITRGDSAYGMVVQSIGGGGGIAIAGSTTAAGNPGSQQFSMTAGNTTGSGDGGIINVSTGLDLATSGHRAMGVVVQSIGGGGGIATSGSAGGMGAIELGSQRTDSFDPSGWNVTLDLSGTVATGGDGAHGIVAQSIGGGGGIVGDVSQAIQFRSEGFARQSITPNSNGGSGEEVSVSFNGNLTTRGDNAHGIVAQSIGGGGGLAGGPQGGFAGAVGAGGTSSAVIVKQWGVLQATGAGSAGIFAQSASGSYYEGPSLVTINGQVQGGAGSGSGVWIAAGKENQLHINAGGAIGALSGVAVRYDGLGSASLGNVLTIDNDGTLAGSVLCSNADGGSACTLNNQAGALATDAVAYDAHVRNDGLIVIGPPGQFQTLTVSGGLTQSASGVLRADVDFDALRSSQMVVQGDADLSGGMDVLPQALLPSRELTVLTVLGASQGAVTAVDSPVFDYETRQSDTQTRIRVESADFNAPAMGLKSNQRQVASHLQRIWDAGGNSALAPLFAQLDLASRQGAGAYRDSVASLSPGVTLAPAAQSAANLGQFTSTMMSCPAFTGADALTGEQDCLWGQVSGRATNQDGSRGTSGFDYDTVTYQFGGQRQVSPGWFVGGSFAYENSRVRARDGSVSGNGDSGYAGVVVKRESGPWVLSAALGGGYGGYRMDRNIGIAGYQDTLSSRPDVYGFNARLRAARTFAYQSVYVKPYVDLDFSYTRMPGYTESGDNALALTVDGSDKFIMGVSPMIEVGGRAELGNGATLRPFVYAGASFLSQDDWTSSAQLRGAPAGTGVFETSLPIDDVVGRIGAGIQVMKAGAVDFRLQYDGQFSEHARSHGGALKVSMPF